MHINELNDPKHCELSKIFGISLLSFMLMVGLDAVGARGPRNGRS